MVKLRKVKNKLKYLRKKYHISQIELADSLKVTKQYVSKVELGNTMPSIDICFRIKEAIEDIFFQIDYEGNE